MTNNENKIEKEIQEEESDFEDLFSSEDSDFEDLSAEMESYFREELKTWSYDEVKRRFYDKYECYGFLSQKYPEHSSFFCYTYDLQEYKSCCPKCIVF